jgi:hypothetical protein
MAYIRINKLLRRTDLSIEELSALLGKDIVLNPNTKLGIYKDDTNVDYNSLSNDELLSNINSMYRVLNLRLDSLHNEYTSLQSRIEHPDIYSLAE